VNILLTGGAGYIGSMTCIGLLEAGHTPVILDNYCNSRPAALDRIERITGVRPASVEGDVRDRALLGRMLAEHRIEAVIHFAGLKAVGESVQQPLAYYDSNVGGTVSLLCALEASGVHNIVFSSSATVYRETNELPIPESAPTGPINPYGRTKLHIEEMLRDLAAARPGWSVTILRYFNPVGAHPSGLLGEDPQGIPNNLMPFVAQVAVGRRDCLQVFGNDYPTPDGTGVRDYIHILDLVQGHIAALSKSCQGPGLRVYNLGRGCGESVLAAVAAFERASGRKVPLVFGPRRQGDLAACWADPALAGRELGWHALRGLDEMCADAWRWQSMNPTGLP
jgi:UDP-glucose 4-epimerase